MNTHTLPRPTPTHTLAFIGLGSMGMPMLKHLLTAGHTVRAFARNPATRAQAVALGARLCDSPADAALGATFVFTNVTATADVQAVLLGEPGKDNGVVHGAAAGTVCIDHSTIAVAGTRLMAAALAAKGIALLDAPVSGGAQGALAGTLSIMVGGEAAAFEAALPLLSLYGKTIVHMGSSGAGQVVKACNQMVQVVNIQGIAEAMHLAHSHGVELAKVLECLSAGMAGSKMLDLMGARMARDDFAAGIQARLHHKDFGLVSDMAAAAGLDLPAVRTTQAQLNKLMQAGMGLDDTSSLLRVLRLGSIGSASAAPA
jgi:3-hydroxyisobutyrate dehydrogenase-like beta-hydroxyacid dehydrogenase